MSTDTEALLGLIKQQICRKVLVWAKDSSTAGGGHGQIDDWEDADVVTSWLHKRSNHTVILDIDHPAWLVRSTTPGHYHLYIDVPGGVEWANYSSMLDAMAVAGVLEPGYVEASKARGYTSVRLPWIKKNSVNARIKATFAKIMAQTHRHALDGHVDSDEEDHTVSQESQDKLQAAYDKTVADLADPDALEF